MNSNEHWMGSLIGPVFGNGPGAGMSVMILLCGILVVVVGLLAYRVKEIRYVEKLVPDYDENQ